VIDWFLVLWVHSDALFSLKTIPFLWTIWLNDCHIHGHPDYAKHHDIRHLSSVLNLGRAQSSLSLSPPSYPWKLTDSGANSSTLDFAAGQLRFFLLFSVMVLIISSCGSDRIFLLIWMNCRGSLTLFLTLLQWFLTMVGN